MSIAEIDRALVLALMKRKVHEATASGRGVFLPRDLADRVVRGLSVALEIKAEEAIEVWVAEYRLDKERSA